jgi:hypothetical protein
MAPQYASHRCGAGRRHNRRETIRSGPEWLASRVPSHRTWPGSHPLRWRPRSGVNGLGRGLLVMLRGIGDGLVDHLLVGRRVQELAAQVLQQAQRPRGHRKAAPAAAGPVKHRPHQRQA